MERIQTGGLLLLVAFLVAPGCMLVVSHPNHPDWDQELAALEKEKEALPLGVSCFAVRCSMANATTNKNARIVRDVLKEGPFSISDGFSLKDDLVARISVKESVEYGPLLFPWLLTAFVIPCYATYTLGLEINFMDREDELFKRYARKAKYDMWQGWAFFVWGICASDMNVESTLVRDMARDVVKQIYEKDYDVFKAYGSRVRRTTR